MMSKNEKLKLGTRFYIFTSEDEYRIVTLVKTDKNGGQFMDEETFELITITSEELEKDYTLLTDNEIWTLCNFRPKPEFEKSIEYKDESLWLDNQDIRNFINNEYISYPYKKTILFNLVVYRFMRKAVFNKMINYIIQLNFPNFQIQQHDSFDDIEDIWNIYFRYINNKDVIIDCNSYKDKLNMDDIVNNKAKIPDAIIDEAEDILGVPILSYDPYEFNESINLNNVNMKHFYIYINDKYYIILYVIDTIREAYQIQENLQNHMDVVQFMLK